MSKNIEIKGREVENLTNGVDEARKVNKIEDERFRKLSHTNAALKAKLQFINTKYDFTSNVKGLSTDDFKQLIASNDVVSKGLIEKLREKLMQKYTITNI